MKLSACIEWLFADETDDIAERVRKAAECGLYGVEFHLWRDKPITAIRKALDETGLVLTSFCVDPRRSIVDRAQRTEFLDAVRESMEPARTLGCNRLIIASGFELKGVSREEHFDLALESLAEAAQIARENGATLLLEPLNTRVDHPGMYLNSVSEGLDLVRSRQQRRPATRLRRLSLDRDGRRHPHPAQGSDGLGGTHPDCRHARAWRTRNRRNRLA